MTLVKPNFKVTEVKAITIPDAWFQCLRALLIQGFKYEVQKGSFERETRLEFDWITITIKHSYSEPYDTMLPKIPMSLGIPDPVAPGYVEEYLPYLMTGEKQDNEDYTYGQRLMKSESGETVFGHIGGVSQYGMTYLDQVDHFIKILKDTPNTNQAIMQVAQPTDCFLGDPPCLRHIDMRVRSGVLVFYPYFRSWDLWAGFPANLAAIAVLQKYMADLIGIEMGPMIASSKGLHIYGYVEELAKLRCHIDG